MRRSIIVPSALVIGAMLSLSPAQADPGTATHVDSLSATVGAAVSVSGTATFVDVPVEVFTDPDAARVPTVGASVTSATFSRPIGTSAANSVLNVKFAIADHSAALPNGTFPGMVFLLPLMADGTNDGYFLMAGAAGGQEPGTDPKWSVMQNQADGFARTATVQGSMGGGKLEWKVPVTAIGAKTGAVIEQAAGANSTGGPTAPSQVSWGLHELGYCCTTADWIEQYSLQQEYVVPGAVVNVGIAPAGTNPAGVALTKTVVPTNWTTGAFATSLPKPAVAGNYIVVAEACYTGADCVRSSTPFTV